MKATVTNEASAMEMAKGACCCRSLDGAAGGGRVAAGGGRVAAAIDAHVVRLSKKRAARRWHGRRRRRPSGCREGNRARARASAERDSAAEGAQRPPRTARGWEEHCPLAALVYARRRNRS
eukprot:3008264-Pleurochrysis_carterae.AAC.1